MTDLADPVLAPSLGILYAEDFDDELSGGGTLLGAEPEQPEPLFTGADLDDARLAAADTARTETLASAELAALQDRSAALARISEGLGHLTAGIAAEIERSTEELARTVLCLLAAALPSLMDKTAAREVSALLHRLLPGLHAEKQVTVRVNPHVAGAIESDLAQLDEDARTRILLVPTDALAPGDLRVSWHEGRLLRDTAAIRNATHKILASIGCTEAVNG